MLERCACVGFGIGFESASSGSAGLVAFWLLVLLTTGGPVLRSRSFGVEI